MLVPHPPLPRYLNVLDDRLQRDGPAEVVRTLGEHVLTFPEASALTPDQRGLLDRVLEVVGRIAANHGQTDESWVIELMTLGKLGRVDEAVGRARAAFAERPTWATAVAAGNALRRAGELRAAAEMFATAADLDPADVTALLEVGDMELAGHRVVEALAAYEAALQREPAHPWAEPSAWYCRFRLTGQDMWLRKLQEAAAGSADECGVQGMIAGLLGGYTDEQRRERAEFLLQSVEAGL